MSEFVGKVSRGSFGKGSKSAHEALYIETGGARYVLRRQGGNPFYDPELQDLDGKRIRCNGVIADYTLLISEWTVIGKDDDG
jgi:hypothetical protein